MATATAKIIIGGTKVDPYNVSLEQRINWHHTFEISVSSEKSEGNNSISIESSIEYIGKEVEISIARATGGPGLEFKGIITGVHIDRTYTNDNLIVFSGFSPTYLLEDEKGAKSYEEKSLANITNEILGEYPGNLLNSTVSPQYGDPIPYVVRYNETNYQFLSRLASLYGEWFYFDGQSLVFGELPKADEVELTLGNDLDSYTYGVQIQPSKFKYQTYNPLENRLIEQSSANFKPGWLDKFATKGLSAADNLFPGEPLHPIRHDSQKDAHLKQLVEAEKSALLSDSTSFNGLCQNPAVRVGGHINAFVNNRSMGQIKKSPIGRFRVISVVHKLDANKNYFNDFVAIPFGVTTPPVNPHVRQVRAESQVGVVKDNNDPEKLGRVRAQLKWQSGTDMTPWMRINTPHASGNRGMYFVPEIGDEIDVDFIHGNPDAPYMQAAHYHGNTKPEWADPENNLKAIKTRSGHTILLDDTEGEESITILDKSGNTIFMDTKRKSITINAPDTLTINTTHFNLNAKETAKMIIGKHLHIAVNEENTFTVDGEAGKGIMALKNYYKFSADEVNGLEVNGQAGSAKLVSKKKMEVGSDKGDTIFSAKKKMIISGNDLNMKGSKKALLQSSDTDII